MDNVDEEIEDVQGSKSFSPICLPRSCAIRSFPVIRPDTVISSHMFRSGEEVFLDDVTLADVEEALQVRADIVKSL